jgi:hypothetical protein
VKQRIKTMTMQARQARPGREEKDVNGNKPTLIAYSVKDARGEEAKAIWTRIGAAWTHEMGLAIRSASMRCRSMAGWCWWPPPRPSRVMWREPRACGTGE